MLKIWKSKSAAGISGKSQILFTIVYFTRYLDVFFTFISVYNTLMKVRNPIPPAFNFIEDPDGECNYSRNITG